MSMLMTRSWIYNAVRESLEFECRNIFGAGILRERNIDYGTEYHSNRVFGVDAEIIY